MKVLISRSDNAGSRGGKLHDFHHTQEFELLTLPPLVCEGLEEYRVKCGCGRAFTGVASGLACTVGTVADVDEAEARERLLGGALAEGWGEDLHDALWTDFEQLSGAVADAGCEVGTTCRIRSSPTSWALATEVTT